jgi:hypothetical protein
MGFITVQKMIALEGKKTLVFNYNWKFLARQVQ